MLFEIAARCKTFRAIIAFKWLFSRMNSLMPNQIGDLAKSFLASRMVTLVGLLLVVDSRMFLER